MTTSMYSSGMRSGFTNPGSPNADIEERMAKELQRVKLQDESKRREIEKICNESEELRVLKEKIKSAYVNKERSAQIAESQVRKIDEIKRDAIVDDIMLQHYRGVWEKERALEADRKMKQAIGRDILFKQMEEKKQKGQEAYQQYMAERDQVNDIINNIIQEDLQNIEHQKQKQARAFQDMVETLEEKKQRLIREKEREADENRRYLEFMKHKEKREEAHRAQRAEVEAMKDKIYQNLMAEQEQKRKDEELLQDLRFELQQEEYDANERKKDRDEIQKKQRFKELMIQAEKDDIALKAARKAEEERIEADFKRQMMEKFATDEKLEQMSQQKKRMKELEFKREVESLWQLKLAAYREQREKEIMEERRKRVEEKMKDEIIQMEKERLIREHLPYIQGFMPKGILPPGDPRMQSSSKMNSHY